MFVYNMCMTRTQIQFPDGLYGELKRVASERDWSLAEVVRRASEEFISKFPADRVEAQQWSLPEPFDCGGDFLADPTAFRAEAEAIAEKS